MSRTSTTPEPPAPAWPPALARTRLGRFRFPVLLVAVWAVLVGTQALNRAAQPRPALAVLVGAGTAGAALLTYVWLSRVVEQRSTVPELARAGVVGGLGRGMVLGSACFTAVLGGIAILGGRLQVSWGSVGGLFAGVGLMAGVAVTEELLFRGVVLRILEERAGTWVALGGSSVFFGATHLLGPHATWRGAAAIAVEAGLLLGAAYLVTRSLWLPMGIHFAWNLTEYGIFGIPSSGSASTSSLLHTTLSGPAVLTGGGFGPEASVVALLVCLVPSALLLCRATRTGQVRRRR